MTLPTSIPRLQHLTRLVAMLGAVAALALTAAPAHAEDSAAGRTDGEVSNVVQELSQEIESPYCPGKTLAMCPSGGAAKVRRDIQSMAEQGMSRPEIKQSILEEHGDEFKLREPPAEDHYPLIALIVVALIICIGAVIYFARHDDDSDADDEFDDEDWSEEDDIYLQEIRERYQE